MGSDRLICFRTDGNSRIATGHLVRCLSIAQACGRLGMKVCFLLSDEESRLLLSGFLSGMADFSPRPAIKVLNTAVFDHPEKELPEITALLGGSDTETVFFVDSYYVTENYLLALRPLAKTVYLDDLQLFDYPVDLLINYDVLTESSLPACQAACRNAGRTLLGASYAPLREQFQSGPAPLRETVSDVLVTTGGSDPFHFCLLFLRTLRNLTIDSGAGCMQGLSSFPSTVFHIVAGKLNTDVRELHVLADGLPFLKLHENVTDMAPLMRACDLAVSAAGTTLYELCALGIPAISFTMADNQLTAAEAFADAGAVPCAGDIRVNPENVIEAILHFITDMSDCRRNPEGPVSGSSSLSSRKAARSAMIRLVDGRGSMKIARAIEEL